MRVGRRLLKSTQSITDIGRDQPDEPNRRETVLMMWQSQKGSSATYRLLAETFEKLGYRKIAEKVKEMEEKLSAVPPPTKRRRLDEDERYDVHSCTHLNKIYTSYETTDPGHHGESLVRDPTDQGGETATTRSRRRSKPDKRRRYRKLCVFKHYNMCTSTVNPDNIVNLSSYRLSNRETDILSKGLSFIPYTPNINYIKSSEIIDFTNKLRLRYKYMHITPSDNPFRLKTKQTPGPTDYKPLEKLIDNITLTLSQIKSTTGRPNLPKDGMCLIHRLKNQHEVIINQADKGSTIVLLDRKTYVAEGHKHLADPETYTRLEHDITDKIKQTIETKLDNLYKSGLLTKRQCEFCYPPESHRTSLMYFLIKLHKNPHTYIQTYMLLCQQHNGQHIWFLRLLAKTSGCSLAYIHKRYNTPHPDFGNTYILQRHNPLHGGRHQHVYKHPYS